MTSSLPASAGPARRSCSDSRSPSGRPRTPSFVRISVTAGPRSPFRYACTTAGYARWRWALQLEIRLEFLEQRGLRLRADDLLDDLAAGENRHRRDGEDLVRLRRTGVLV